MTYFNEEIKKRYLDINGRDGAAKWIFNKTAGFEEKYCKDASSFTTEEIENMLKTISYEAVGTVKNVTSILRGYTDWCISEGLVADSQNHYNEINSRDAKDYANVGSISKSIVTRDDVLSWCEGMKNPMDQFIVLGLFEGIGGKNYCDFFDLCGRDINVETSEIRLHSRGVRRFSSRLCAYGIDASEVNDYYYTSGKAERVIKLEQSDVVIKDYPNVKEDVSDFRRGRRIYSKLRRALQYVGHEEYKTGKRLQISGIFDMAKRRGDELGISMRDYLKNYTSEIEHQYGAVCRYEDYLEFFE